AYDINDHGQIVGEGFVGGHRRAFMLTPFPGPVLHVSMHQIDFGRQQRGTTSSPRTITLTNAGNALLPLRNVTLTGSCTEAYAITAGGDAVVLQPGESRTISVVFAPPGRYAYNIDTNGAMVTITDVSGTVLDKVELDGFVTVPGVRFTPDHLDTGSQRVGVGSEVHNVTLFNPGLAPLELQGATLTGENAAEFTLTAP